MRFEWDDDKNEINLAKHGLDFSDAEQVLDGPCMTFEDVRFDYGEKRFISIGVLAGRVVVVAHTPRPGRTRIISMRKANDREQETYQKRLGSP